MADRCGVSRSAVSRQLQQASADALKSLCERRFEEVELLVIYLDGKRFGGHQVICAVGVDTEGGKHVLGLTEGATENAVVAKGLLEEPVARGVSPERRRLFVIDGSKGLRAAIEAVYGKRNPVQRCRNHKRKNVLGYVPKGMQGQVGRRCGPRGSWTRRKEWRGWAGRSSGWSERTRRQRRVCGRDWRRPSPSISWGFRRCCASAWRPPM